jgi:hypothetical protein
MVLSFSTFAISEEAIDPLDKVFVDVHLYSLHKDAGFEKNGKYYEMNQVNLGVGFTLPAVDNYGEVIPNLSYRVGGYYNSYSSLSLYGGLSVHSEFTNGFGIGLLFGLVSGYSNSPNGADVLTMAMPEIHYIHNNIKAEIGIIPAANNPAITLTISFSFY